MKRIALLFVLMVSCETVFSQKSPILSASSFIRLGTIKTAESQNKTVPQLLRGIRRKGVNVSKDIGLTYKNTDPNKASRKDISSVFVASREKDVTIGKIYGTSDSLGVSIEDALIFIDESIGFLRRFKEDGEAVVKVAGYDSNYSENFLTLYKINGKFSLLKTCSSPGYLSRKPDEKMVLGLKINSFK